MQFSCHIIYIFFLYVLKCKLYLTFLKNTYKCNIFSSSKQNMYNLTSESFFVYHGLLLRTHII